MKKFLAMAVIAASMVACGNNGDKKADEPKDTTKMETPATPDTTQKMAPDTTVKADTATKM